MGLLLAAAVIGTLLAFLVLRLIYVVVGRAVENAIRWAILNFGNDEAVRRLRQQEEQRDI